MSLLCDLGYHKVGAVPRWNDGYYFARCDRCRADLVRTPFSRWHVPQGYRVVWQADPPASRPVIALEPELELPEPATEPAQEPEPPPAPAAPAPPPVDAIEPPQAPLPEPPAKPARSRMPLPVEALLERLRRHPAPLPAPEDLPAAPVPPPRPDWDFMMDPGEPPRIPAPLAVAAPEPPVTAPPPQAAIAEPPPRLVRTGPSVLHRAWSRSRRSAAEVWPRTRHNKQAAQGLAAAIGLGAILLAGFWLAGPRDVPTRVAAPAADIAPNPFEAEPESLTGEPAFVAARALACRDAPALQARRVRVLARGASVGVLARDGDWVSLETSAGQCWALARYLSAPIPL